MTWDFTDPNIFNLWRERFQSMTDAEHKEFADLTEKHFPSQQHFTRSNFEILFRGRSTSKVMEIGGWKGELAHYCLNYLDVFSWVNFEFCRAAVNKTLVPLYSLSYKSYCPEKLNWFLDHLREDGFDACVASHTIEHLSNEHFIQLVDHIAGIPLVMFEAPLHTAGNNWHNDFSTHILTIGWNGVNAAMERKGYRSTEINPSCFRYEI